MRAHILFVHYLNIITNNAHANIFSLVFARISADFQNSRVNMNYPPNYVHAQLLVRHGDMYTHIHACLLIHSSAFFNFSHRSIEKFDFPQICARTQYVSACYTVYTV
jgi:hypothetical protein